jgi:lipopolysaccharide transport system ATP-binding protein
MASDPIITVENLSKSYAIRHKCSPNDGLRHLLQERLTRPFRRLHRLGAGSKKHGGNGDSHKSPTSDPQSPTSNGSASRYEEFWALRDVSLEVRQGEVVGIIGHNGAGKSTLLKILSRITEPTRGRIELTGRVASLLEVGTGFHPELSGRENIFLNGAILGMTRSEIRRKFDEIVSFAEVEKFLDTPVKRYSSGMYVRLAFAVAAHLEPEILVVDEVLAVGDAAFQKRCLGKMREMTVGHDRTILFVSHNMSAIASLCQKAILLRHGRVAMNGPAAEVVSNYLSVSDLLRQRSELSSSRVARTGDGRVRFVAATLKDPSGSTTDAVLEHQAFEIELELFAKEAVEVTIISITIVDPSGIDLFTTFHYDSLDLRILPAGRHRFQVRFSPNFLAMGVYNIRLACFGPGFYEFDHIFHAFLLKIDRADRGAGGDYTRPGNVALMMKWTRSYDA